jgi:chromosome segregation ATPase
VASLASTTRKPEPSTATTDGVEEVPAPNRARRASDGQVNRLQGELRLREEIRRLSDEMASLARDAQVRIAELEDQVSRGRASVAATPLAVIGRGSADAERARAAAEQHAAEAEARAEAAEAATAQAESRLREAQAAADALRVELETLSATSEGRAPSLRDRLAEAAAATEDPSEHQASG